MKNLFLILSLFICTSLLGQGTINTNVGANDEEIAFFMSAYANNFSGTSPNFSGTLSVTTPVNVPNQATNYPSFIISNLSVGDIIMAGSGSLYEILAITSNVGGNATVDVLKIATNPLAALPNIQPLGKVNISRPSEDCGLIHFYGVNNDGIDPMTAAMVDNYNIERIDNCIGTPQSSNTVIRLCGIPANTVPVGNAIIIDTCHTEPNNIYYAVDGKYVNIDQDTNYNEITYYGTSTDTCAVIELFSNGVSVDKDTLCTPKNIRTEFFALNDTTLVATDGIDYDDDGFPDTSFVNVCFSCFKSTYEQFSPVLTLSDTLNNSTSLVEICNYANTNGLPAGSHIYVGGYVVELYSNGSCGILEKPVQNITNNCPDTLWVDTIIVDAYNTYHYVQSYDRDNCSIDTVSVLVCKPLPPPVSNAFSTEPNVNDITRFGSDNMKQDGTDVPCGECARHEIYIETTTSKQHYQTIWGNTGGTAGSATSTLHGGWTEDILNHITASDIIFDCATNISYFNFDSETFVQIIAEQLQLSEAVTIRIYTYIGGSMCPNAPASPLCEQESTNTDNFAEICQAVVLELSSFKNLLSGFVDTLNTNTTVVYANIGDTLTTESVLKYKNGTAVKITTSTCHLLTANGAKLWSAAVPNIDSDSNCENADTTIMTFQFNQTYPCVALFLSDLDRGSLRDKISNITPASFEFEPTTAGGMDPTYDALGNITGLFPSADNQSGWLYFSNTDKVTWEFTRTGGVTDWGQIKLCGC